MVSLRLFRSKSRRPEWGALAEGFGNRRWGVGTMSHLNHLPRDSGNSNPVTFQNSSKIQEREATPPTVAR